MSRKKILFYHPFFNDGGVEKTNLLISEKLVKKYEVFFISNYFSNKFESDFKRIGIKKIKLNSKRTIFSFFELSKIFKKLKQDIIIPIQMHANVLVLAVNKFLFNNYICNNMRNYICNLRAIMVDPPCLASFLGTLPL